MWMIIKLLLQKGFSFIVVGAEMGALKSISHFSWWNLPTICLEYLLMLWTAHKCWNYHPAWEFPISKRRTREKEKGHLTLTTLETRICNVPLHMFNYCALSNTVWIRIVIFGFFDATILKAISTKSGLNLWLLDTSRMFCFRYKSICLPSITDGVHRNKNFVEIIPVFSTFSNFFKKKNIYI